MQRRPSSWRPFALAGILVVLVAACAGGPAQWTFQPTPQGTPAPSGSPGESPTGGTTACSADAQVVKIEETASLTMVPNAVTVAAGKPICFEVTNSAGFAHNFYVGPTSDIESRNRSADVVGTPDFSSGTQMFEWTPNGSGPFEYACWIQGHLEAGMKGSVTVQ